MTVDVETTAGASPNAADADHLGTLSGETHSPLRANVAFADTERQHASGVVPTREVALVRGAGARVWDADGHAYVDLAAGHGVANVGHAHPHVSAAIARQAERLLTCPASFPNDQRAALYRRLTAVLPNGLERLFFCNSGTEAVEAALKFARLVTGRPGIVALMRGFHGRTLGALAATWEPKYRAPFEPLVPGVRHVPAGRLEALDVAIDADTACVVLEVVQGEGGVHPLPGDYLRAAQALCRARGALLIVDEVQTGFGRTGRLFACEHVGLEPDLLCLGKAIAGGLPMGAVAIGPRVGTLPPGSHGSTFGGNPLACAAALATLDVLRDEGLPHRAERLGQAALERLRALDAPVVREVRGCGLMIGIELKTRARFYLEALLERGFLALPAGATVVRLLPPLTITEDEFHLALDALASVLRLSPIAPRNKS